MGSVNLLSFSARYKPLSSLLIAFPVITANPFYLSPEALPRDFDLGGSLDLVPTGNHILGGRSDPGINLRVHQMHPFVFPSKNPMGESMNLFVDEFMDERSFQLAAKQSNDSKKVPVGQKLDRAAAKEQMRIKQKFQFIVATVSKPSCRRAAFVEEDCSFAPCWRFYLESINNPTVQCPAARSSALANGRIGIQRVATVTQK